MSTLAAAAEPAQSYVERFGGVKQWVLIYSYSCNSPISWTEGVYHKTIHTRMERESGRVVIPGTDNPAETRFAVNATGRASSALSYGENVRDGSSRSTRYDRAAPTSRPFKYYAVGLQPLGTKFCTSPNATGINLPHATPSGTKVPGFFGSALGQGSDSPVGNCLGAMRVKDW